MVTVRRFLLGVTGFYFLALWTSVPAVAEATSIDCHEEVKTFLSTPNKLTALALSGMGNETCWKIIGSSNSNLDHLIRAVKNGNQWAAWYLAKHLKNLDGGNLEDSLIALGQFANRDMENLLNLAKEGELSNYQLRDVLTMLPLSLSDNPNAQLKALEARRSLVRKVARPDLRIQKETALKAIGDFETEIKSHMQSAPSAKTR